MTQTQKATDNVPWKIDVGTAYIWALTPNLNLVFEYPCVYKTMDTANKKTSIPLVGFPLNSSCGSEIGFHTVVYFLRLLQFGLKTFKKPIDCYSDHLDVQCIRADNSKPQ